MKAKKRLVIATLIASGISLLLAFLFQFFFTGIGRCGEVSAFVVNFSFAVFGSALLGFIMSLVEYFVSKKHALENYYLEALRVYNLFSKIEFLLITEPKELLMDHFSNEMRDVFLSKSNNLDNDKLFDYMKIIWQNTIDIPEPELSDYTIKKFNEYIKSFIERLSICLDSYIEISNEKIAFLDTAYAEFDFMFCNKSLRSKIYKGIHKPFSEHKKMIEEKAFHFRTYKKAKNGNTAVMIDLIDELQQKFFTVDKETDECFEVFIVHRHFLDEMENKLEKLRCCINHEEYKPIIHYAHLQYRKRIKAQYGINAYYAKINDNFKPTD